MSWDSALGVVPFVIFTSLRLRFGGRSVRVAHQSLNLPSIAAEGEGYYLSPDIITPLTKYRCKNMKTSNVGMNVKTAAAITVESGACCS